MSNYLIMNKLSIFYKIFFKVANIIHTRYVSVD